MAFRCSIRLAAFERHCGHIGTILVLNLGGLNDWHVCTVYILYVSIYIYIPERYILEGLRLILGGLASPQISLMIQKLLLPNKHPRDILIWQYAVWQYCSKTHIIIIYSAVNYTVTYNSVIHNIIYVCQYAYHCITAVCCINIRYCATETYVPTSVRFVQMKP